VAEHSTEVQNAIEDFRMTDSLPQNQKDLFIVSLRIMAAEFRTIGPGIV